MTASLCVRTQSRMKGIATYSVGRGSRQGRASPAHHGRRNPQKAATERGEDGGRSEEGARAESLPGLHRAARVSGSGLHGASQVASAPARYHSSPGPDAWPPGRLAALLPDLASLHAWRCDTLRPGPPSAITRSFD